MSKKKANFEKTNYNTHKSNRDIAEKNASKYKEKAVETLNVRTIGYDSKDIGKPTIEDYSITEYGIKVELWDKLKRKPLPTDTYERFDHPLSIKYAFENYIRWAKLNPFIKPTLMKSGELAGQIIDVEIPRPISLGMFLSHIKVTKTFWENKKKDKNFSDLCILIEETFASNQIDGAIVGVYDSPTVMKLNKVEEKVTVTHQNALNVDVYINGNKLPNKLELNEIEEGNIIND